MKLQFHLLTAFPPHNVNRDEDGRPKTALLGAPRAAASPARPRSGRCVRASLQGLPAGDADPRGWHPCLHAPRDSRPQRGRRHLSGPRGQLRAWRRRPKASPRDGPRSDGRRQKARRSTNVKRQSRRIMVKEGRDRAAAEVRRPDRALGTEQRLVVSTREHGGLSRVGRSDPADRDELAGTPAGCRRYVDRFVEGRPPHPRSHR